jgi:hypothetical protein
MDLSRIPEPVRSRLAEQLAQLPPDVRATLEQKLAKLPAAQLEAVLKKSAPMLERLAGKSVGKGSMGASSAGANSVAGGKSASSSSQHTHSPVTHRVYDPHDHFNQTVQRGDRATPPFLVIFVLVAAVVVLLRVSGIIAN